MFGFIIGSTGSRWLRRNYYDYSLVYINIDSSPRMIVYSRFEIA